MALVDAWTASPAEPDLPTTPVALAPEPDTVEQLLGAIRIRAHARNEPVVIEKIPAPLRLLGSGTDAVVVQHPGLPERAFKVYAPETVGCLADEYEAYRHLAGSPYFARCLGRGAFYLVLSYEPGPTLYECLVRGIPVPERVMADVEAARHYARQVGLHPKDIHLKNVLLQADRARIIDVSKYVANGDEDRVWDDLAEGYRRFYPLIRGRRIPVWVIEMVKRRYKAQPREQFSLELFGARMLRMLALRGQVPKPPSTAMTWPVM
ncbi:MAG: serine/threonine protein kinase [Actinomycetota bacterium]